MLDTFLTCVCIIIIRSMTLLIKIKGQSSLYDHPLHIIDFSPSLFPFYPLFLVVVVVIGIKAAISGISVSLKYMNC